MKTKSFLTLILGLSSVFHSWVPYCQASEQDLSPADSTGFTFFADALWWQAEQLGTYGIGVTTDTSTGREFEILVLSFPWDWGMRTGFRCDTGYDHWTSQFYYTWFHTQTSIEAKSPPACLLEGSFNAFGLFQQYAAGKMDWALLFNMFDWELGRTCTLSKTIFLEPFLGIKGGWIDQTLNARYRVPDFSEHVENNFYCVGPKGGVNGKWALGKVSVHDFSLFGDVAGAFMWGHWNFEDVLHSTSIETLRSIFPDKMYGAFMTEAMMGFEWDVCLNQGRSQFALRLGYEVQFWLNQLQIPTASSGTTHHDLTLQGGTFEANYKF